VLCCTNTIESATHLFWNYSYAKEFWQLLIREINIGITTQGIRSHIQLWKYQSEIIDAGRRRSWEIAWAAGLWAVWRERNGRIFSDRIKSAQALTAETVLEIRLWERHC
jgi:hypothetical protein